MAEYNELDAQMKKGLLETCVFAALENGESYGYKIIEDLSHVIEISESTLYPILKRLEASNFLSVKTREHNGRLRKYYCLTPPGINRLGDLRWQMQNMKKIFNFIGGENE